VRPTLLNGPVGTELERRGFRTTLPRWSADAIDEAPALLSRIHADYARAGATVHVADTFRTKRRNVGADFERMAHRAVELARAAVPAGHRVLGSIAPLMDCYRPDLSPGATSFAEHAELALVLRSAGVDGLLCETFPALPEAHAAAAAAVETGLPTWLSFTAGPEGDLLTPAQVHEAARRARALGIEAILINCTADHSTLPFIEAVADSGLPFGAYANAGSIDLEVGFRGRDEALEDGVARYVQHALAWRRAGATIVGSCCGTRPEHIAALAAALTGAP
jgi:S-methylmethionine-dependent homocysteine/selenocysteine methylase